MLEQNGFVVTRAQSQSEAEEMLMRERPDIAVFDLMMEEMDSGFVLCHEVKKLYPDTPVVLLTAVNSATGMDFSAKDPEAGSWTKADALIDKPARSEQLVCEVRRLLRL